MIVSTYNSCFLELQPALATMPKRADLESKMAPYMAMRLPAIAAECIIMITNNESEREHIPAVEDNTLPFH
jgi:hypothetical protein